MNNKTVFEVSFPKLILPHFPFNNGERAVDLLDFVDITKANTKSQYSAKYLPEPKYVGGGPES